MDANKAQGEAQSAPEIDVASWEEFERAVRELRDRHPGHRALLFRGQPDAAWPLRTTLERHDGVEMPFEAYYRVIAASEPQVRSFTDEAWEPIESYPAMRELAVEYDRFDLHLWGGKLQALGYLAYLRHFGFPSPLLDWTRSAAIAAFFAFRPAAPPSSGKASIFVYCERPTGMKMWDSGRPRIFGMGPNVRTARRHHLQQGEYTMCLQWETSVGWRFVPHERVFAGGHPDQDLLWKFNLPWSERVKVMLHLDEHNVNAFSLFESNEALLETLALRRLVLEPAKAARAARAFEKQVKDGEDSNE